MSSSVSFSDNINAFNGAMGVITNVMNKTKNIAYDGTKNLTKISGIVNTESLGVLGVPVATTTQMNTALSSKADVSHNHDSSYAPLTHTHSLNDVSISYEEEEEFEEEEDGELITKTRTVMKTKRLNELLNEKANTSHTHTLREIIDYQTPDLTDYATTSDLNSGLATKASSSHTHSLDEVVFEFQEEESFEEETLNEEEEIVYETKTRTITKTK